MAALPVSILTIIYISSLSNAGNITLKIHGNSFFSTDFLFAQKRQCEKLTDIENFIMKILDLYGNAGFPFCTIRPELNYPDSVILHITEGERITVKDYVFRTDGKTDIAPLRRISHFSSNKFFALNHVKRTKKTILRTGAFSTISESIWEKDGEYYVLFEITEKSSDNISTAGSFSENQRMFSFELTSLNLFGTLRQFHFSYNTHLVDPDKKNLFMISFTEPIILNPVTFNTTLSILTYDSMRLSELGGTFTAPMNEHILISISSGIEMTDYHTETINISQKNGLFGAGMESEFYFEKASIMARFFFDYLIRKHERFRIRFDGAIGYARFFLKPHCNIVISDIYEYFDYYRLGGAYNLRGYMEDQFLSKKSFWANIEYKRFPFYPLCDIAWIDGRYEYSYGLGIDTRTALFNTSLVFAWPRNAKWNDGKVHLTIEKSF